MFPRFFRRSFSTEIRPKILVGNEKYIIGAVAGLTTFSIVSYLDNKKSIEKLENRMTDSLTVLTNNMKHIHIDINKLNKIVDQPKQPEKISDDTTSNCKQRVKDKYNKQLFDLAEIHYNCLLASQTKSMAIECVDAFLRDYAKDSTDIFKDFKDCNGLSKS